MNSKILLTAMLLICGFSASAQEEKKMAELAAPALKAVEQEDANVDRDEIYRAVQTIPKPTFNTSRFLAKNLKYPEEARQNEIRGRVNVQFVVEKDGSLSDIIVLRGGELGHGIPEEAIRVISTMPKWKPATQSGKPVRSYFTMPVDFNLQ